MGLEHFKEAVKNDWRSLATIPEGFIPAESSPAFKEYLELCLIAINSAPDALQYVRPPADIHNISDDYLKIYVTALNHHLATANTVKYIPLPDLGSAKSLTKNHFTILEKAAHLNAWHILGHLMQAPLKSSLYDSHLELLRTLSNSPFFSYKEKLSIYFPSNQILSEKEIELYLEILTRYPSALRDTDPNVKEMAIETLGLSHFILADLTLIRTIPNQYWPKAETLIKDFLQGKNYFIITPEPFEGEIKSCYLAYSNNPKRNCIHLPSQYDQIKDVLTICSGHLSEIKLVIMGHTLSNAKQIADLDASKILSLVQLNKNIKEVVLLGCKTAVLKKTDEETALIENIKKKRELRKFACPDIRKETQATFLLHHGSILNQQDYLLKLINKVKELGLPSGFVLTPGTKGETDRLFFVYNDNIFQYNLHDNQRRLIIPLVGKCNKVKMPSEQKPEIILVKHKKPLGYGMIKKILDIAFSVDNNFDHKDLERYKRNKAEFPFLRSFTLSEHELEKIDMECLLGRVVKEFKEHGVRNVTVKAFAGVMYADTKELRFYAIHSSANVYNNKGSTQLFFGTTESIDRQKLLKELDKEVENLDKDDTSVAKAIRVKF